MYLCTHCSILRVPCYKHEKLLNQNLVEREGLLKCYSFGATKRLNPALYLTYFILRRIKDMMN